MKSLFLFHLSLLSIGLLVGGPLAPAGTQSGASHQYQPLSNPWV